MGQGQGGRPRLVILGGGFAGVCCALALERAFGRRDDYEVVLVNDENYFVFQPMLPEVISGTIGLTDVVSPIRQLLTLSDVHVRPVESVDLDGRGVDVRLGARLGEAILQDGERIPTPGQCFGEMALIREATRSATVRCTETMDVLCLPKQEFAMLAAHLPDLRRSFERMSEERAATLRRTDP